MRVLALVLGLTAALPAFAQLFDDNEARRRIELLRQQVEAMRKSTEERLQKAESAASAAQDQAADRGAMIELSQQLEALRNDIARMRGQLEQIGHQVETGEARQKQLYLDIDTRLRRLEQAREQAAAAPPPEKPAAQAEGEPSPGEAKAYQAALDQFKLGNYSLAVAAMQGFLVTYPSSPLAANAQYWIGMAYSGQRDYKNAIAAQRKLLTSWPDSPKAPDAMLSIASAQETMGDCKSAKKSLQDLAAKYPASSSATSAKQRLAVMSKRC
jgi:tol-pal system protein YbgF